MTSSPPDSPDRPGAADTLTGGPRRRRAPGSGGSRGAPLPLLLPALLTVLGVLILGSYTRKERVQGVVQARDGVAMVVVL